MPSFSAVSPVPENQENAPSDAMTDFVSESTTGSVATVMTEGQDTGSVCAESSLISFFVQAANAMAIPAISISFFFIRSI